MKKLLTALVSVMILASAVHADLYWMNSLAINDQNGVALAADESDYTIGCFAQLIYCGANNSIDFFSVVGSGVTGDDVVMATMFAGQNEPFFSDGFFPAQSVPAVTGPNPDGIYYVRVYNAPNANFAQGNSAPIPTTATHYFESATYNYTHSGTTPNTFDFAPDGGQTMNLIPEPAMLGLGVIGLISLRLFARKRK